MTGQDLTPRTPQLQTLCCRGTFRFLVVLRWELSVNSGPAHSECLSGLIHRFKTRDSTAQFTVDLEASFTQCRVVNTSFSQNNCDLEAASECCLQCSWIQKIGREFPILFLLCAKNRPEYLIHSVTFSRDKKMKEIFGLIETRRKSFSVFSIHSWLFWVTKSLLWQWKAISKI